MEGGLALLGGGGWRSRSAGVLDETGHELGEASQVTDEAVERAGEAGELAGEKETLLPFVRELAFEAFGELLERDAAGHEALPGGLDAVRGRGVLLQLDQGLSDERGDAVSGLLGARLTRR